MVSRLILVVVLSTGLGAGAPASSLNEYDVKAAFLVNFARYVEWPSGGVQDAAGPLVICVLGRDPFGKALDDLVAGKSIDGRELTVRRIPDAKSAGPCRILFVGSSERKSTLVTAQVSPESGILTVGDADSAVSASMVINFTMEGGKVRFTVNMDAADRAKIRLSSHLLGLASSVKR